MRAASSQLPAVLVSGSFNHRWVADLWYDGQRVLADLPISEPTFNDDGDSLVQGSGSCTVVYTSQFAESVSPVDASSILAPFGAELAVYVIVETGEVFSERVEMGWYRITDVPGTSDSNAVFQGKQITLNSTVKLTLQDRMEGVAADSFDTPGSPPALASTFAEVTRVSGLQLTREIPDGAIARSVAYESDRLQYVYDLIEGLAATPYMRSDGTLGQRPDVWPAAVDTLRPGDFGSLVDVGRSLSAGTVYNRVVIRAASGTQQQILATAQLTVGPLRAPTPATPKTPWGRRTYFYSSELVVTTAQAQALAPTLLAQVSNLRAVTVPVTEIFNPLREVGDVLNIVRPVGSFAGRVKKISRDGGATQTLTLEVT